MLCQSCGENNASIHFTKIVNGNVEEIDLCEDCTEKANNFNLPFSFHKLFTGLIDPFQKDQEKAKDSVCLNCGLTYNEFLETGMFGCSDCFNVFEEDVNSLLKGIHGHNNHVGRIPLRANSKILHKKEIQSLKEELEKCIFKEEFEDAATLRDEIKMIENELDNSKE